ncbi:conserved hypothetical protein [Hyella patelloides LEGE 07179]|uniref:Uncharacterized protein n=1 Tax=Hyella patelloides LEGE 07179 TaxID=945734 RepID=A0A563VL26_9CYAN|nr:hypothetical protein [Hyella patelloides]VEP12047.1 conserved hypothetical protein [Hyella patelloides LEGE 07179]
MSVGAFISNPVNKNEIGLYIPVATESFYRKAWLSGSEELRLKYIPLFSNGIDIKKEELFLIQDELKQLRIWAKEKLDKEDCERIVKRINFIDRELPKLFLRKDTVVFIG